MATKIAKNEAIIKAPKVKGPKDISDLVKRADNAAIKLRPFFIKKRDFAKKNPSKDWIKEELESWVEYLEAQQKVVSEFTELYNRLADDFLTLKLQLKEAEKKADRNWLLASQGAVALAKFNRDMLAQTSELYSQISELKKR